MTIRWGITALMLMLFGIGANHASAAGNVTVVQEGATVRITGDDANNHIDLVFDTFIHVTPNDETTVNGSHETLSLELFLGIFIIVNLGSGEDELELSLGTADSTYTLSVQVDDELISPQGNTVRDRVGHQKPMLPTFGPPCPSQNQQSWAFQ